MAQSVKKIIRDFLGDNIVLVVEPTINYRTSIKQFLTNLHVRRIKVVGSVADARREMLTTRVGLFIVEWALDDENGLQFCRGLRKDPTYRDTPFLLLSTENQRQDVILASEVAIDAYLLKPFSYADFAARVLALLRNRMTPPRLIQLLDLAEEKLERGDLETAQKLFTESLHVKERSARAQTGLARICKRRGDIAGAMDLLKTATQSNPDYIEAYRAMFEIAEETKNLPGRVQAAEILHSLSPDNPRYSLLLASAYLEMGRLEDSEKHYKKTITMSPRLAEAYKGLGTVNLARDELEKALKNFNKALDLDGADVSTLNSIGMTFVRMGRFDEGITRYLVALKLDPHDARVLFNIGYAHEKQGELDRARHYYQLALVRKAGYERALRGLERVGGTRVREGAEDSDDNEGLEEFFRKSS